MVCRTARLKLLFDEPGWSLVGKLIYSMLVSLDGYVADAHGDFSWAQPTEAALAKITTDMANVGTFLYGRRMYDIMAVWETAPELAASSPQSARFAEMWQAADKMVYSQQLDTTQTTRTELLRAFEPDDIVALKRASDRDLTVDGPTLAAEAFRHNLVDQVFVLMCPTIVGSGLGFWPQRHCDLRLRQADRLAGGIVYLKYDVLDSQRDISTGA